MFIMIIIKAFILTFFQLQCIDLLRVNHWVYIDCDLAHHRYDIWIIYMDLSTLWKKIKI